MCVCLSVCPSLLLSVGLSACLAVCGHVRMSVCMRLRMFVFLYGFLYLCTMYVCMYACMHDVCVCAHAWTHRPIACGLIFICLYVIERLPASRAFVVLLYKRRLYMLYIYICIMCISMYVFAHMCVWLCMHAFYIGMQGWSCVKPASGLDRFFFCAYRGSSAR